MSPVQLSECERCFRYTQSTIGHTVNNSKLGSRAQHFKCAGNQRIDTAFDISLPVEHLDVNGNAVAFVAHHVSRKVRLIRQTTFPTVGECLLKLIREDTVGMVPYDRNVGQLPDCKGKGLAAAKNGITGQECDRPGELCPALRLKVPGLQPCIITFAWSDLRPPAEGDSLAVAKSIDDRDCNTILPARAVTDIDDKAVETAEVSGNRVQSGFQSPAF